MKLQLQVPRRQVEQTSARIRAALRPDLDTRLLIVRVVDGEITEHTGDGGRGSWPPLADRTERERDHRTGHYRRGPVITGRTGTWGGDLLTSALGRGVGGRTEATENGIRRTSTYVPLNAFHFGSRTGQPRRPVFDEARLRAKLGGGLREHFATRARGGRRG